MMFFPTPSSWMTYDDLVLSMPESPQCYSITSSVHVSPVQEDVAFVSIPLPARAPAPSVPTPVARGPQSRDWCFTCNNPSDIDKINFARAVMDKKCSYLCFEIEHGTGELTPHLQGFLQLKSRGYISACLAIVRACHYEVRKGSVQQARDYCKKEDNGSFVEWGLCLGLDIAVRGQRTDIDLAFAECHSMVELAQKFPIICIKFGAGFAKTWQLLREADGKMKPQVIWLSGPTGCGKTATAFDEADGAVWISGDGLKWFDGYDGQPNAIIDDFRATDCSFNFLLRVLDRYPLRVPVKGGFSWWNPQVIVITCPRPPEEEFVNHATGAVYEDVQQVVRRCDQIRRWDYALRIWIYVKGAPMHVIE